MPDVLLQRHQLPQRRVRLRRPPARVVYQREPEQAESVVPLLLERFLRVFQPPLRQVHHAEITVRELPLRVEIERLFHRRFRLLQETRAEASARKGSVGPHAQRVERYRPPKYLDRLLMPAEISRQPPRAAQDLQARVAA